jgi:hypothetical protein
MTTINDAYTNALLADASYVDNLLPGMTGVSLAEQLTGRMTPALGAYLGNAFTVVEQVGGLSSSFDATVWRGRARGHLADMVNWWLREITPALTDADTPQYATQIVAMPDGGFSFTTSALGTGNLTGLVPSRQLMDTASADT